MNKKHKHRILLKTLGWVFFGVNGFLELLMLSIASHNFKFLFGAIIALLLFVFQGWMNIYLDKQAKDFSMTPLVTEYICLFILSCILVYTMYEWISFLAAIVILCAMVVECIVVFIIIYYYRKRYEWYKKYK